MPCHVVCGLSRTDVLISSTVLCVVLISSIFPLFEKLYYETEIVLHKKKLKVEDHEIEAKFSDVVVIIKEDNNINVVIHAIT